VQYKTEHGQRAQTQSRAARKPIPLSEPLGYSAAEFATLFGRSSTWAYRQIYAGRIKPISDCAPGGRFIPREKSRIQSGDDWRRRMSARKRSASRPQTERTAASDSDTFGTPELCTWAVGPGTSRFQTRRPDFARKLSQRSGAGLVAWSVAGGYLRVFQERIEPWRARDLVKRFLTATNGAFSSRISSPARRRLPGVSRQQHVSP